VLARDETAAVARVALGLTLFLEEPLAWAREGAADAFRCWWSEGGESHARWIGASWEDGWHPLGSDQGGALREVVSAPLLASPRHLFRVRAVDDPRLPACAFVYREVDDRLAERTSTIELLWPPSHDAGALVRVASALAARWPVRAAIGGYRVVWNERAADAGWGAAWRWSRSCLGLDAYDAEAAAWRTRNKLPGAGWLTLIGRDHSRRVGLDLDALARPQWRHGVSVQGFEQAVLIQAGERPTLGDRRRCEVPAAYAEVARTLAGLLPDDPPMGGPFSRDHAGRRWMRRLIDPEAWT
jgi:hypothetical protein